MKINELNLFQRGHYDCVSTDCKELNECLCGGLRTGDLIVFEAASGCGKTTTLQRLAINSAEQCKKCMFISGGEQPAEEIVERMACMMCGYDYSEFIKEYKDDQVENAKSKLERIIDYVDVEYSEDPFANYKIEDNKPYTYDMEQFILKAVNEGIQFIFFDYIGSSLPELADSTYAYYTHMATILKSWATKYHLCIVTAIQMNRAFKEAIKNDKKYHNFDPNLVDETFMADSIGPARKASVCIAYFEHNGQRYLNVFKNRLNGKCKLIPVKVDETNHTYSWSEF